MRAVGVILRWVGAVFAAALIFVIVYVVGALIRHRLGAYPSRLDWPSLMAAFLAVTAGTYVVAREQRGTAALVLSILICAAPLWAVLQGVLGSHFSFVNFETFCSVLVGSSTHLMLARSGFFSGKRANRVAGRTG
jgi:hypothetical protein